MCRNGSGTECRTGLRAWEAFRSIGREADDKERVRYGSVMGEIWIQSAETVEGEEAGRRTRAPSAVVAGGSVREASPG